MDKSPYIGKAVCIIWRLALSSSHKSDGNMIKEGTEIFYGIDNVMNTVLLVVHSTNVLATKGVVSSELLIPHTAIPYRIST